MVQMNIKTGLSDVNRLIVPTGFQNIEMLGADEQLKLLSDQARQRHQRDAEDGSYAIAVADEILASETFVEVEDPRTKFERLKEGLGFGVGGDRSMGNIRRSELGAEDTSFDLAAKERVERAMEVGAQWADEMSAAGQFDGFGFDDFRSYDSMMKAMGTNPFDDVTSKLGEGSSASFDALLEGDTFFAGDTDNAASAEQRMLMDAIRLGAYERACESHGVAPIGIDERKDNLAQSSGRLLEVGGFDIEGWNARMEAEKEAELADVQARSGLAQDMSQFTSGKSDDYRLSEVVDGAVDSMSAQMTDMGFER